MTELRMCLASEVDGARLGVFLRRFFGAAKGDFLLRHGSWWHRGDENRWVLLSGEEIAGYCGVIPTHCLVAGRVRPALWWMDLVIAPEFRGRGLQTRFDDLVRSRGALLLGFPNGLAARIHLHHGWGVREDLQTRLMPLDPRRMGSIRRASGRSGAALRLAASAARPVAALWRAHLRGYRPRSARRLMEPDFEQLAAIAADHLDPETVTTRRDASYLRWRYGEGPHRFLVYVAGPEPHPKLVLVARRVGHGAAAAERWLDLFGDLGDAEVLGDMIRFAAREAALAGVAQITVLAADRTLGSTLRRHGFVLGSRTRFCWLDEDRETMDAMSTATHHWSLGDSDNDEPEGDEAVSDPT